MDDGAGGAMCNICGKILQYAKQYSMRRHLENVHLNETRIKCQLCGKKLKNQNALKEHLRYMHNVYKKKRVL